VTTSETLPSGWRRVRLRYLADIRTSNVDKKSYDDGEPVRLCNYTDVYHNEYITDGMDFMRATASDREIERFSLRKGDVVITKDSESWDDIGIPACVAEDLDQVVCGYHLTILRPIGDLYGPYLLRALRGPEVLRQLHLAARGITRYGLSLSGINDLEIPLPPPAEQRAIAANLDRETARIDALVEAKTRLLDRLAAKRQALVTQAVTRGLDPDAPRKDSGVDWLGEVPAHWEVMHLRRALAASDYGTSQSTKPTGDIGVLRMGDIQEGEVLFDSLAYVDEVDEDLLVKPGDLLFNRTNSMDQIGKVGLVRALPDLPVSFASYLVRLRTNDRMLSTFAAYLLNSSGVRAWAQAEARPSIGQANLNPTRYSYLPIALPALDEQRALVSWLSRETAEVDALMAKTRESVARLGDRRSALIAETVTGRRRVPV